MLFRSYAHTAAAALRIKDSVMETVTNVQLNAEDVLAQAKDINAERAKKEAEAVVNAEETEA